MICLHTACLFPVLRQLLPSYQCLILIFNVGIYIQQHNLFKVTYFRRNINTFWDSALRSSGFAFKFSIFHGCYVHNNDSDKLKRLTKQN
jgi:hypothetical protein